MNLIINIHNIITKDKKAGGNSKSNTTVIDNNTQFTNQHNQQPTAIHSATNNKKHIFENSKGQNNPIHGEPIASISNVMDNIQAKDKRRSLYSQVSTSIVIFCICLYECKKSRTSSNSKKYILLCRVLDLRCLRQLKCRKQLMLLLLQILMEIQVSKINLRTSKFWISWIFIFIFIS